VARLYRKLPWVGDRSVDSFCGAPPKASAS
jgi:hypothetical protein